MTRSLDRGKGVVACNFVSFQMISRDQMNKNKTYLLGKNGTRNQLLSWGTTLNCMIAKNLTTFCRTEVENVCQRSQSMLPIRMYNLLQQKAEKTDIVYLIT